MKRKSRYVVFVVETVTKCTVSFREPGTVEAWYKAYTEVRLGVSG
jgi:hypothetical protein